MDPINNADISSEIQELRDRIERLECATYKIGTEVDNIAVLSDEISVKLGRIASYTSRIIRTGISDDDIG